MPRGGQPPPWPLHPLRTSSLSSLSADAAPCSSSSGRDDLKAECDGAQGEGQDCVRGWEGDGGSAVDRLPAFASNMRAACTGSTGLQEAEDSCYSKRLTTSMSPMPGSVGASLAGIEPEEENASGCLSCLPSRWGNRSHIRGARSSASKCEESGESCQSSRPCGDSRSEGRRKSFWARETRGEGQDVSDHSNTVGSPSKGIAGRLRDLEEGLRSLAVSHSHLKLDHGSKLEELEAAFAKFLQTAHGSDQEVQIGDEAATPKESATEAAMRQEIIDLKMQLASVRDETRQWMAALETKWSMVSAFESRWRMVASTAQAAHLAAQDAGMQAAAAHERVEHALQRDPVDPAVTSSSKMLRLASPSTRPLDAGLERGEIGSHSVLKSGRLLSAHSTPRVLPVSTPKSAHGIAKEPARNGAALLTHSLEGESGAQVCGCETGVMQGQQEERLDEDVPATRKTAPDAARDGRSPRRDVELSSEIGRGEKAGGTAGRKGRWRQNGKLRSETAKGGKDATLQGTSLPRAGDNAAYVDALVYEAVLNTAVEVDACRHEQVIDDIIRDLHLDSRKGEEDEGSRRPRGAGGDDDGLPKVAGVIEGLQVERDDQVGVDEAFQDSRQEEDGQGGTDGVGVSAEDGAEDPSPSRPPAVIPEHGIGLSVASPLPMGQDPLTNSSDQPDNHADTHERAPFKDLANHPYLPGKPSLGGTPALRRWCCIAFHLSFLCLLAYPDLNRGSVAPSCR